MSPRSVLRSILMCLILVSLFSPPAAAASGDLDPAFGGGDGRTATDFGSDYDWAEAVAMQSNGRAIVVGSADLGPPRYHDFAVSRYLPDGRLDRTFSGDGKLLTDFDGEDAFAQAVVVQPDGKILVAGGLLSGAFAVARYLPGGVFDTSFSGDGRVLLSGGYYATSVALQDDGKIVLAGYSPFGTGNVVVMRLNSVGALDPTFGDHGRVSTDVNEGNDLAEAVLVQRDGRIVVVGASQGELQGDLDFFVARYTSRGVLDSTFAQSGIAAVDFAGDNDHAFDLQLMSDGKLVVGGFTQQPADGDYDFALARLTRSGGLDPTFGTGGLVVLDPTGEAESVYGVGRTPSGRLVVAGRSPYSSPPCCSFLAMRLFANGSVDPSFGSNGFVEVNLGATSGATDLLVRADGRSLLVGGASAVSTGMNVGLVQLLA